MVVRRQGRPQEAEPLYREELAIRRRRPGEPNALGATLGNLAQLLQARGDLLGAQPLFREALAIRRQVLPPDHPEIAGELAVLGQLLIDIGNSEEAEPLLRECLDIRERILPEDDPQAWLRYNTMSLLGAALLGQGEFEQAEPLLIESYEKMQPPPGPVTGNRKREALERIAKLYEDWDAAEPGTGKAEQAAEYRALLDAFDSATDH
jgi:tetratricopeptide (TPR) repeat protein